MGKKVKTGKARKDKFYKLAKETGYRARSAFKLLQLNRKFEFLQNSRVCVDLCAAPGSWCQVAVNHMPVSSLVVGIDLVPIKPIFGVTTFTEDITTDKCRQQLKKELQTWKVDVFLNDGAPNVGKNWIHDAFAQSELTLSALKLATEFLRPGGWFVTKIFRSKDYTSLLWVFGQMFKKVHATKPQASRNESAEIFVVCQGYKAPDKIDAKFLDPKYVFKEVGDSKKPINLVHPEKERKKAEGYVEGDYTQHHKVNVTDFITSSNHLELLANCSELVLDSAAIARHSTTTEEIKECCKDIKLLGKKELRNLLTWRKKIKKALEEQLHKKEQSEAGKKRVEQEEMEVDSDSGSSSQDEDSQSTEEMEQAKQSESESGEGESDKEEEEKVKQQLSELQDEERKALKRKRKKVMKEKRKLRDKMSLNMVIKGDHLDITDDISLFNLNKIKSKQQLSRVEEGEMWQGMEAAEDQPEFRKNKKLLQAYDRFEENEDMLPESEEDEGQDSHSEEDSDLELSEVEEESEKNPLLVKLDPELEQQKMKAKNWFDKDIFTGLEEEKDEDLEIEKMIEDYKKKGGVVLEKVKTTSAKSKRSNKRKQQSDESEEEEQATKRRENKKRQKVEETKVKKRTSEGEETDSSTESSHDEGEDSDYEFLDSFTKGGKNDKKRKEMEKERKKTVQNKAHQDGFEIVPQETVTRLSATGLAIGEELIKSSKRRREIIEDSYNRYTFEDPDCLPDWFIKDESRHMKRTLPVSKETVEKYKERLKAINARPIKKIAEAQARKKKKMVRRMEKARKKAEVINEAVDVGDKEKVKAMKEVYKKAGLLKKKKEEVSYVVARRGTGKKVSRPPGIKGRFKVVDPRLKKDLRNSKIRDKKVKKKGGSAARSKFTRKTRKS